VHEGDEPDVLVHLPHAHLLASKDLAEIHLPIFEADAAAIGDRGGPVVQRVVEFAESAVSGSTQNLHNINNDRQSTESSPRHRIRCGVVVLQGERLTIAGPTRAGKARHRGSHADQRVASRPGAWAGTCVAPDLKDQP
jgi:hypothetical protein